MLQRFWLFLVVALLTAIGVFATVFGTVRGIVHDQQHRPISTVLVVLKAANSEYTQTTQTNTDGEFIFDSVPTVGQYKGDRVEIRVCHTGNANDGAIRYNSDSAFGIDGGDASASL